MKRATRSFLGLMVAIALTAGIAGAEKDAGLDGIWYGAYLEGGKIQRVNINVEAGTIDLPGKMVFDLPVKTSRTRDGVQLQGDLRGITVGVQGRVAGDVLNGTLALADHEFAFQASPDPRKIIRGRELPAFEVTTLGGERKLTNESLAGKYTLIDFWATWCGVCQGEVPHLEAAYEKYKDKVSFLSISVDEDPAAVNEFRKQRAAMPWTHANVSPESELVKQFEIGIRQGGLPLPILVGPDGKILSAGKDELSGSFRIGYMLERFAKR